MNTATATGKGPGGVDVPARSTVTTDTAVPVSALSMVKKAVLADANSNGVADLGETISYSFVVENTGSVTVDGVTVSDLMIGAVTCPAGALAPGASVTCVADAVYTVTEADLLAGGVVNTATATGKGPGGVDVPVPATDTVTTDTVTTDTVTTDTADPADPADPAGPADSAAPADPAGPADPADQSDQTGPIAQTGGHTVEGASVSVWLAVIGLGLVLAIIALLMMRIRTRSWRA